jgi:hypothetical protein
MVLSKQALRLQGPQDFAVLIRKLTPVRLLIQAMVLTLNIQLDLQESRMVQGTQRAGAGHDVAASD